VTAAELDVLSAQQALEDLHANAALAKAQALTQVSQAYAAVREAQYQLYYFLSSSGISDTDPIHAMEISQQELQKARQEFDQVRFKPENDPLRRTLKERLDNAESSQQNALRRLELEAQLQTAQANLDLAKDAYNRLKDGADPRQVALAEARLKDAQARLAMAQATLAQASLTAPFSGTITTLEANVGETVLAGSVVAVLGDLQEFRVETSDLSEIDIKNVQIGQKVRVRIEALNQEVNGKVIQIAPQSNTLGGDVVYTVVIALDEKPDGLRWGMSAEVEIITE
jgi:multidrug resistance efflux pump